MPMSFPDMRSLKNRAAMRGFRAPFLDETEEHYRDKFADFMVTVDRVESGEIRSGQGWDVNPFAAFGGALFAQKHTLTEECKQALRGLVAGLTKNVNVALSEDQMRAIAGSSAVLEKFRTSIGFLGRYSDLTTGGSIFNLMQAYVDDMGAWLHTDGQRFVFGLHDGTDLIIHYEDATDDRVLEALYHE